MVKSSRLDARNPAHQRILARAAAATPPPTSWWTRKDLTWKQFTEMALDRAKQTEERTNQAVQRKAGDR